MFGVFVTLFGADGKATVTQITTQYNHGEQKSIPERSPRRKSYNSSRHVVFYFWQQEHEAIVGTDSLKLDSNRRGTFYSSLSYMI